MKINTSSKLLITSLAIVFFSILSGLVVNLLTSDNDFNQWLKSNNIGTGKLVIGVVISGIALIVFTFLQFRYSQQIEQTPEKEDSSKDIESDVKKYYESLKERYLKRYESKLDGRFEITLEVSENWDGDDTKNFKGEYEGKGQISEAFEYINSAFEKHGRLLIVGSPGVGKTVLLLKLALELLEKADIEKKEAFPVIFNLASWSDEYENFDDWLISVLNSGEGLSKEFAGKLLQEERIIFLLDGLDEIARSEDKEIAAEKRAECLQSLNDYLNRGKKAVICCRAIEFELMQMLTEKDAPVSAKVKINDLSKEEVLNSLKEAQNQKSDRIAAINLLNILNKNSNNELIKVLNSPFYFTTALEVFDKQILDELNLPKTATDLKNYLRRNFIEKKLNITSNPNKFNEEKTKKWLSFLAELINRKHLITFELADLQPIDLAGRQKFGLVFGLVFGLAISLVFSLAFGLFIGLVFGLVGGLASSLIGGLVDNLFGGLVGRLVGDFFDDVKVISTEDIVSLDFLKLSKWIFWKQVLLVAFVSVLSIGLLGSLVAGLVIGLLGGLLGSLFVGLFVGFNRLKSIKGFSNLEDPYQRIKGGFLTNFYFSFLLIMLFILGRVSLEFYFRDQNNGLYSSLILLPIMFLYLAAVTLLATPFSKHLMLRICFYIEDKMPLKYATFLDYAAEARILEKDGGHWRFRHQNLQDYFAGLDEQTESPMGKQKV